MDKLIHQGRTNQIWHGRLWYNNDEDQSEQIAVKVLSRHRVSKDFIEREVQIMHALNHQNIVKFYCAFQDFFNIYLCMEFGIALEYCFFIINILIIIDINL